MKRIAIVFASKYGQTKKIAERLSVRLGEFGHSVQSFQMSNDEDLNSVDLDAYDAVIIGAPVYAGKFPHRVIEWTKSNLPGLNERPTAFFSVSLNAADKRLNARKEDIRLISKFLSDSGLQTKLTASLVGALHYREYNFLVRWLLKRISKSASGPTDTSRDHELTEWQAVEAFAREIDRAWDTAKELPHPAGVR